MFQEKRIHNWKSHKGRTLLSYSKHNVGIGYIEKLFEKLGIPVNERMKEYVKQKDQKRLKSRVRQQSHEYKARQLSLSQANKIRKDKREKSSISKGHTYLESKELYPTETEVDEPTNSLKKKRARDIDNLKIHQCGKCDKKYCSLSSLNQHDKNKHKPNGENPVREKKKKKGNIEIENFELGASVFAEFKVDGDDGEKKVIWYRGDIQKVADDSNKKRKLYDVLFDGDSKPTTKMVPSKLARKLPVGALEFENNRIINI